MQGNILYVCWGFLTDHSYLSASSRYAGGHVVCLLAFQAGPCVVFNSSRLLFVCFFKAEHVSLSDGFKSGGCCVLLLCLLNLSGP